MKAVNYYSKVLFFILAILFAVGCSQKTGDIVVYGTLRNYTGTDGCGWVIVVNGIKKTTLEPQNLNQFNLPLKDGEKVMFTYAETGGISFCMIGPLVKIISIKKI